MATYIKAGVIAAIILLVVVMLVGRRAHADHSDCPFQIAALGA
jgi:hypothetical protein